MNKVKKIKKRPAWLLPSILIAFVFLIYGNSINNQYSLDDDIVTSTSDHQNKRIEKGIKGIPGIFNSRYYQSSLQNYDYRPVVLTSFAIEYQLFKQNPEVSHFINILLYAATCLLLFSLLSGLLKSYHVIFPLLITLLFAAHPLHTEVVDSLKNRDELLSFFFGLFSLKYSLKYVDNKKILSILAAAIFILLAFLSKKTAIVFVPIIPLTIYFFREVKLSRVLTTLVILIATVFVFILLKKFFLHDDPVKRIFVFTENPLFYEHRLLYRLSSGLYILLHYLKQMFIPYPLSSYYGYDIIPMTDWTNIEVWISFFLHSTLLLYAVFNLRKKNLLAFGILFYLIAIFPYSNFLRPAVGIVADRFVYAASLGFCFPIGLLMGKLCNVPHENILQSKKISLTFIPIVIGILLIFSALTYSRNPDWKNMLTLLRKDVKNFENSYNIHYIMFNVLSAEIFKTHDGPLRNKLIEEALMHCRKVAEIVEKGIVEYPEDYTSMNNLGTLYVNYLKTPEKAQHLFEKAIVLKPDYTEAYYNLAFSYEKRAMLDSATKFYEMTIAIDPYYSRAYSRLYECYIKKTDFKQAIEAAKKSVKAFPENAEFCINLGNVFLLEKDTVSGIAYFEQALKIEPNNLDMRKQILSFLKTSGRYTEYNNLK